MNTNIKQMIEEIEARNKQATKPAPKTDVLSGGWVRSILRSRVAGSPPLTDEALFHRAVEQGYTASASRLRHGRVLVQRLGFIKKSGRARTSAGGSSWAFTEEV